MSVTTDEKLLIIALQKEAMPSDRNKDFWGEGDKTILLTDDIYFTAKNWTHYTNINGVAILKFFRDDTSINKDVKVSNSIINNC